MKATVAKISESGKSACVMLQDNPFSMDRIPVYIPNNKYTVKQEIEIPDNLFVVTWGDRTTEEGIPLKTLSKFNKPVVETTPQPTEAMNQ